MPSITTSAYAATTQFQGNIGTMIVDADPMVKFVLLVLLLFSVFSWGIILQKWIVLSRARSRARVILESLARSTSMVKLKAVVENAGDCPVARLFREAQDEMNLISEKTGTMSPSAMTNIETRIADAQARQGMDLSHGLGFLASISNASPFIGLFGTVWGVMDSFREIGVRGSASLATVAPGISEALIATAAGLFVAIPAVLFYNLFTGTISQASSQMEQFRVEFMNWLRRGMLHADK